MPPGLPANAPHYVYGIYWIIISIGMAMAFLVPLGIKAYAEIHNALGKQRQASTKLQQSADAAAINSAIVAHKIDALSPGPDPAPPAIRPVIPVDTTELDMQRAASQVKEEESKHP
jgi:hypothetical protein